MSGNAQTAINNQRATRMPSSMPTIATAMPAIAVGFAASTSFIIANSSITKTGVVTSVSFFVLLAVLLLVVVLVSLIVVSCLTGFVGLENLVGLPLQRAITVQGV